MSTQLEQAMAMAKKYGYTVSPQITKQASNKLSAEQRIAQLELENSVLKAQGRKPQRTSLVESSHYNTRNNRNQRNQLSERVNALDWQQLASLDQPLPEGTTVEQLLKDFGQLFLMKSGHYGEIY